jgi:hypothetical protein
VIPVGLHLLPNSSTPSCVRATAWTKSHPESLPTTLSEFAAFPAQYRSAVFTALSPQVKASLWREHLAPKLTDPSESVTQKALIARLYSLITPDLYSRTASKSDPPSAEFADIAYAMRETFDRQQLEFFTDLTADVRAKSTLGSGMLAIRETIRNMYILEAGINGPKFCTCNISYGYADTHCSIYLGGEWCGGTMQQCTTLWWGCGIAGEASCDGCCDSSYCE